MQLALNQVETAWLCSMNFASFSKLQCIRVLGGFIWLKCHQVTTENKVQSIFYQCKICQDLPRSLDILANTRASSFFPWFLMQNTPLRLNISICVKSSVFKQTLAFRDSRTTIGSLLFAQGQEGNLTSSCRSSSAAFPIRSSGFLASTASSSCVQKHTWALRSEPSVISHNARGAHASPIRGRPLSHHWRASRQGRM
jgi:hypothetical protein